MNVEAELTWLLLPAKAPPKYCFITQRKALLLTVNQGNKNINKSIFITFLLEKLRRVIIK